ncbi:hypothetical protein BS17DRAFT_812130 [Gyrodon lividus]|nr:hypothetical protein BS17DRAFT_812130 [Gyrodon lividus]
MEFEISLKNLSFSMLVRASPVAKYDPDLFDKDLLDNLLEIEQDVALGELGDGPADAAE